MTSIDHILSAQTGLTPQVSGYLNHVMFWAATFLLTTTQITITLTNESNLRRGYPTCQGGLQTPVWNTCIHSMFLQSIKQKILRSPLQGDYQELHTWNQLLWSGISPQERYNGAQDQGTHTRQPYTTLTCHQIMARFCKHHDMDFLLRVRLA